MLSRASALLLPNHLSAIKPFRISTAFYSSLRSLPCMNSFGISSRIFLQAPRPKAFVCFTSGSQTPFIMASKKTTGSWKTRIALFCKTTRPSPKDLELGVTTLLGGSPTVPMLSDVDGVSSSNSVSCVQAEEKCMH
ncbi:hypothetical protein KIN20_015632 [Parelaphostrongylus tenuis]|uniref:Uncharacterized protein n=1 Tax=Parelaphostrongylus tenuis TaxID=148309 RepID=A0AAD5MYR7_PARTN|nr:hypothetical protein KIN20_015632 [Parelaphostrongylus tenuis]